MSNDGVRFGDWLIPDSELEETFDTAGGPGGQHANRNRTAVTLRFKVDESSLPQEVQHRLISNLGGPVVETIASDSRSQWRNRATARRQLGAILEKASRPTKPRRATRPSRASKERRLQAKRRRSEIKDQRKTPSPGD